MTEVHNNLEVVLPPDSVRDDAMLATAANNALAAGATVPEGVEATARNGNLTLTGAVQYLSQHAAVEKVVSGLIGVAQVRNEINVVCGVEPTTSSSSSGGSSTAAPSFPTTVTCGSSVGLAHRATRQGEIEKRLVIYAASYETVGAALVEMIGQYDAAVVDKSARWRPRLTES